MGLACELRVFSTVYSAGSGVKGSIMCGLGLQGYD